MLLPPTARMPLVTREERSRGAAREAGDVMAFGQEVGRVLSDGRIVGRAEPFAKVFSSSRAVKRAVGVTAWAVLEDIALDARIDDRGRLVAETNVRRIAENLGLNKETVSKHLGILREYGFVLQEEERDRASGQYRRYRYVIDPTAGIERFTHTPSRRSRDASEAGLAPRTEEPDAADRAPRLASPDPAPPVPAPPVPGDPGQQEQEDQSREQRHDATESL